MRKTQKTIVWIFALIGICFSASAKLSKDEKNLAQKWKMWKVEETGKEVEPTFSRFLLEMKHNKTFSITADYKITHRGTWEYSRETLILHDKVTNKDIVLPVSELDHSHLVVSGLEGSERKTFMTPIVHKDAVHLSHDEHLLVKKWTIYESNVDGLVEAMYDFHEDKKFDFILAGHTVPVSSGTWTLAEDGSTITLHLKKGEEAVLEILEFHRHSLITKSKGSGTLNKMHDAYLAEKEKHHVKEKVEDAVEETQDAVDK